MRLLARGVHLIFVVVSFSLTTPSRAITPLAEPQSEAAKLVLRGEISRAMKSLDASIEKATDPISQAELRTSRLVLHHIIQDGVGYAKDLKEHISSITDALKKVPQSDRLYVSDLLLAASAYGQTMYREKGRADKHFLRFERQSNTGSDAGAVGFYKTVVKASVAYRFKETDFSYDLLGRATLQLVNSDIHAPLTQLALLHYVKLLTYQICDQREIELVFSLLNKYKLLDPKSPVISPHMKAGLLGSFYDSGLLSAEARQAVVQDLKAIALAVPIEDRGYISELLNQKEANELLIRWVSDERSAKEYAKGLDWLHHDGSKLSLMAAGTRVVYQANTGQKIDLDEVKKGLRNMERFLQLSGDESGDLLYGHAKSIGLVLESLLLMTSGQRLDEIKSLEKYVAVVLEYRQRQSTWIGYHINRDDFVQLTVSLYVSKRLSELDNRSEALAELNHYILQTLALQRNAVQIQSLGLYQSVSGSLNAERVRGYLALSADRLRVLSTLLAKSWKMKGADLASPDSLSSRRGLYDLQIQAQRVRTLLQASTEPKFTYFTLLRELDFGRAVFFSHGNFSAYGVSVSKIGAEYRSKFWSEEQIAKQELFRAGLLDRKNGRTQREALNNQFWESFFDGLHDPLGSSSIVFGSGPTIFGVPVSIASKSLKWVIDSSQVRVFPSARQAALGHKNDSSNLEKPSNNKFEYAFMGVGDPEVLSNERIAAIADTESLIRGVDPNDVNISLQPLPDTSEELRAIASRADGPTLLALQSLANKRVLRTVDYSQIEITSFATHGVMSYESGLSSPALLLTETAGEANSRFLTLDDINLLVGVSPVVLLSACNTATVDSRAQQSGLSGSLMEGFIARGARVVISSYWAVDSEATRELMTNFSHIFFSNRKNVEVADSFWNSVRDLKAKRHDFLQWGAFVPTGEYRRPDKKPKIRGFLESRLWIHDASLHKVDTADFLTMISSDRPKGSDIVSRMEVFDVTTNSVIGSSILENAVIESAKVLPFGDRQAVSAWINLHGRLRTRIYSLDKFEGRGECEIPLTGEKGIYDFVTHEGVVYLTTHAPDRRIRVLKINPSSCEHSSIRIESERWLGRLTFNSVGLFGFKASGPETIAVSFSTQDVRTLPNRRNSLNQQVDCGYAGGLAFARLDWVQQSVTFGQSYLAGFDLPELINVSGLGEERGTVPLRYTDTCDYRNYVIESDMSSAMQWSISAPKEKRRLPVKTFFEVQSNPSGIEASLNGSFAYTLGLRRLSGAEGYISLSSPVMPVYLSADESTDGVRRFGKAFLESSSFFLLGKNGEVRQRIRSAVGCEGGFSFFSGTDRFAVVGCKRLEDKDKRIPRSMFLLPLDD